MVAVAAFSAQSFNSSCESNDLTRPATGDTSGRWTLICIAGALIVAIVTWLCVRGLQADPGWRRAVGGGAWIVVGCIGMLLAGALLAIVFRRHEIEADIGGCREVPVERRPESLVDISCGDFEFEFPAAVAAAGGATLILFGGAIALMLPQAALWLPGGASAAIALGSIYGAIQQEGGGDDARRFLLFAAYVSVPAFCFLDEYRTRRRQA